MAVVGIAVVPWPTPIPEVLIDSFVPGLITVDPRGFLNYPGRVRVTGREIVLSTSPRSQPTVHVLTAEVPFTASFSVSILKRDSSNVFPFQVKVWNPRAEVAADAWYAPDGAIYAGVRASDQWRQTRRLGEYAVGGMNTWRIERAHRWVRFEVWGNGQQSTFEVNRNDFPVLFEQETLSLTLYASSPAGGSSSAIIQEPLISVPHQIRYGTTVRSPFFRPAVALVAILSLIWVAARTRIPRMRPKVRLRDLVIVLLLGGTSLTVGWWLSKTPGHPVDIRTAVLWSGIAREEGLSAIVGHSLIATEGFAHGGQPYAAMSYPYPPLLTYLFWVVGKVATPEQAEQTFKMLTTVGVAAGGTALYVLLRSLRVSLALSALAAGAYLLNPAILFDSAVWGQTDAFVALFLLMGAAGIVLERAPIVWTGTLLALLTKQTGAMFAPILILLGLTRLGVRVMIRGIPLAVIIVFLTLTPAFLSGIHTSAIYRPVITKILAFGTVRSMEVINAVLSQSSFTLWSTVAGLEGVQGLARLAFPDFIPSRFGTSYFAVSRVVFALFVGLLGFILFRMKRSGPSMVFLVVAVYAVGASILLTRVSPRYLYFGVMFAAASLPWMPRWLRPVTLAVLTGTMLVAMWGMLVLTSVWYPGLVPAFEPERSWLNNAMAMALGSDIGITLGGLLNMGVLLALFLVLWPGHGKSDEPPRTRLRAPATSIPQGIERMKRRAVYPN